MNRNLKKTLLESLTPLLKSRNQWIVTEVSRIILGMNGIWPSASNPETLPVPSKATAQLSVAKEFLFQTLQHKAELKRQQNRKAYLRKKLKRLKLEAQQSVQNTIKGEN